jgi:hypothetical protein
MVLITRGRWKMDEREYIRLVAACRGVSGVGEGKAGTLHGELLG